MVNCLVESLCNLHSVADPIEEEDRGKQFEKIGTTTESVHQKCRTGLYEKEFKALGH